MKSENIEDAKAAEIGTLEGLLRSHEEEWNNAEHNSHAVTSLLRSFSPALKSIYSMFEKPVAMLFENTINAKVDHRVHEILEKARSKYDGDEKILEALDFVKKLA